VALDAGHPLVGLSLAMNDRTHPAVQGFRFAGMACGIKAESTPDLGVIVADEEVPTAAMFTRNRIKAAPVLVAQQRIERGRAQAILVNSGNANACTGKAGLEACKATTARLADALDVSDGLVLPASTGVIGEALPFERITAAVPGLVERLSPDAAGDFARAILTTDRWPKVSSIQLTVGGKEKVTILGIAKGAGMIHPDMATTLAFVVTDAPMSTSFLERALRNAVDTTFNEISVDGETSTNDAVFAMASGKVDVEPLRGSDPDARHFMDAMTDVLGELSKQIVRDGEGAERVVRIQVIGAPSEVAGRRVAESVARSILVKTAIHGRDPNWGRILAAAGNSGVAFDEDAVEIRFGDVVVCKKGLATGGDADERARRVMERPEYTIQLKLGPGKTGASYLTCDIGEEYVRINSAYRS